MRTMVAVLLFVLVCSIGATVGAVEIEAWMVGYTNESARILQGLVDDAFTSVTGIGVNIVPISWGDYYSRYLLAAASGDTPDIFTLGTETVDFGLRGALVDLRRMFGAEYDQLASQVFPATLGPFEFRETRFGIPFRIGTMISAFRTDILEEMGAQIPQTWAEAYPLQQRLRAQGRTLGFDYGSLENAPHWGSYTLITQHGGNFFGEDGFSSAMDRPQSIAGFKEYINLFAEHGFPKAGPGHTPFINGQWVMTVNGAWLYPNLVQTAPQLAGRWELSVLPGTRRSTGEVSHSTFVGSSTMTIAKQARYPKESWEFIKWFVSAQTQTRMTNEIMAQVPGWIDLPANMEALYAINLEESVRETFFKQVASSVPVPYAANVNVLYRYVEFAISESALLGIDPEVAARRAADQMNQEMSRRKVEYERFLSRLN